MSATNVKHVLVRDLLGMTLRDIRLSQHRTLREVSSEARVSLGYLSELERGRKECSSELLLSVCEALRTSPSAVLLLVSERMAADEAMQAALAA